MNPFLGLLVGWTVISVVALACGYLAYESNKVPRHPADYSLAVERVLQYVDVVAENPARTDSELISLLTQLGVSRVDAHLLAEFVPTAFTWALLETYGFSDFPKTYTAISRTVLNPVNWPLASEKYFVAAGNIAREVIAGKRIERLTPETIDAIAGRSEDAEVLAKLKAGGAITWEDEVGVVVRGVTPDEIRASRRKGTAAPQVKRGRSGSS